MRRDRVRRGVRRLGAGLMVASWLLAGAGAQAEGALRAGFGEVDITPALPDRWRDVDGDATFDADVDEWTDGNGNGRFDPVYLAGFHHGRVAASVHDPLKAVAVVFDDGERRIGIVTADVVGLSHGFADAVRAATLGPLGLDYVLVHATHNHQGPDTQGLWGPTVFRTGRDSSYATFLRDRMAGALRMAVADLAPARLEIAEIRGRDRRIGTVDTRPPRVIDDGIRAAIVRDPGGAVLGTLVNFGNHVELLWDRNLALTADVAGYARRGISQGLDYDGDLFRAGLGGTTLWLTGNIGGLITTSPEVAVRDVRDDVAYAAPSFAKARAQGYAIAEAVLDTAAAGSFADAGPVRLAIHRRDIRVPIANLPLVLASSLGVLDRQWSLGWGATTESEVALLEVGPLWIACIPGEMYPEIAVGGIVRAPGADLDVAPVEVPPLRPEMRGRVDMMVDLANDALGYLIPRSEWDREPPWLYGAEEESYGEIVSAGPDTAAIVHGALLDLLREAAPNHVQPQRGAAHPR